MRFQDAKKVDLTFFIAFLKFFGDSVNFFGKFIFIWVLELNHNIIFEIRVGKNSFRVINLWDCMEFYAKWSGPKLRWSEVVVFLCPMDSVFLNI